MLICIVSFLFLVERATLSEPWVPPFPGKASLRQVSQQPRGTEVLIDPRGGERLLDAGLDALGGGHEGTVRLCDTAADYVGPQLATGVPFQGTPRAALRSRKNGFSLESELYQSRDRLVLSGPLVVDIDSSFFARHSDGLPLDCLATLPRDTEKAVVLDISAVRIPQQLEKTLLKELERWEFRPSLSLARGLRTPLCYARWDGAAIIMMGLQNASAVKQELASRYPPSLIKTAATWAEGTRIVGLDRDRKPAWYFRGDQLVATPTGGVDRLARFLTQRYQAGSLSLSPGFDREFQRLANSQKGWHLCAIENSSEARTRWAVLLRWQPARRDRAEGYLLVQLGTKKELEPRR